MKSSEPIVCDGLSCGYAERVVLRGVELAIEPGKITALLGPNGSGKSTLLKTLSKTVPSLAGEVRVQGRSIAKMGFSELARIIAYVPQEEHVPFRFKVREVVMMGRMPHSSGLLDSEQDNAAADEAMALAGCDELRDRAITELSGGEKQRVLLARALAQQAPILLLDEPTSHLDIGHQVAMVRLLHDLAAKGITILAAVHDLNLASLVATNAVLLRKGRIGMAGACEDVLEDPLLDEVYGVRFERLTPSDGRLRLFPV